MSGRFSIDQLAPGDVLLYRAGDGIGNWLSALIRKLDGTEVSHAGLYVGEGIVAEALAPGLVTQEIDESIAGCQWVAVRRLRRPPGSMRPVLEVAERYLDQGDRYAFEQILLLAGICLTRKLDLENWLLRRIAQSVFDQSATLLERFRREGQEPMICSEFVFRTYDEAMPGDDDPYSLEILSQADGRPQRLFSRLRLRARERASATVATLHPDSLLGQLQTTGEMPTTLPAPADRMATAVPEEDLDPLIEQYLAGPDQSKSVGNAADARPEVSRDESPEISKDDLLASARRLTAELADATARRPVTGARDGSPHVAEAAPRTMADVVADFVTPGDLLKSPSLHEVGRLTP